MSTQPTEPAASAAAPEEPDARQFTSPIRHLAAMVLVSVEAVLLATALIGAFLMLLTADRFVLVRTGAEFSSAVNTTTIALPVLAVLIATHLRPMAANARTITTLAVVEYIVAIALGFLLAVIGLIGNMGDYVELGGTLGEVCTGFLAQLGMLGLAGLALLVVFRVYQGMFAPPKLIAYPTGHYGHPGMPYGHPQYGQAVQGSYGPTGYGPAPQGPVGYGQGPQGPVGYGQAPHGPIAHGQGPQGPVGYGQSGQSASTPPGAPGHAQAQAGQPQTHPAAGGSLVTYMGPTAVKPHAPSNPNAPGVSTPDSGVPGGHSTDDSSDGDAVDGERSGGGPSTKE